MKYSSLADLTGVCYQNFKEEWTILQNFSQETEGKGIYSPIPFMKTVLFRFQNQRWCKNRTTEAYPPRIWMEKSFTKY